MDTGQQDKRTSAMGKIVTLDMNKKAVGERQENGLRTG